MEKEGFKPGTKEWGDMLRTSLELWHGGGPGRVVS